MRKVLERGRSLLEMLAVLAIVAILILATLFLINNLYKYYQRKDTVKQMDTIVTHYRSNKLMRRRNGIVQLKDILPGAQGNEITRHEDTLTLVDEKDTDTFVVIANIKPLTCEEIVQEGNYDGVSRDPEASTATNKTIFTPEEAKEVAQLKAICQEGPVYFMYGKERKTKCTYYIDGNCSECARGEKKDRKGKCCSESQIDCGICGGCQSPNKYCANDTTCVECTEDSHCPSGKKYCVDYKCVPCKVVGEVCTGTWPANTYCNSEHECETCQAPCYVWNGYTCVETPKKGVSEKCSQNCECESGNCEGGLCKAAGACTADERTCQDKWGNCICCSPKTRWDDASKTCNCPLGYNYDEDQKKCIKGGDLVCEETLSKGDSCSAYTSYPDGCCDAGLYCKNGTCECKTLSKKYQGECNRICGCDESTEFVCEGNQCVCPAGKRAWNTTLNKCVECNLDTDCTNPDVPVCDPDTHICVGCLTDTDCEDDEYCDTTTKICKPRCTDADMVWDNVAKTCVCKTENPTQGQACSTPNKCCGTGFKCSTDNICVGCITDTDCTNPDLPICDPDTHICVECDKDSDCEGNEYCDPETKTCEPRCEDADTIWDETVKECVCKADSPTQGQACSTPNKCCTEGLKCSTDNICVECEVDADCEGDEYCNPETKTCEPRCEDADTVWDDTVKDCVCKADSPTEGQACSTPNHCCAGDLVCNSVTNLCGPAECPADSPIGYDPATCECPEGYVAQRVFSGELKCFPICTPELRKQKADVVFMLDNSSSLKTKINGTTILAQIKAAIKTTEIPNEAKYAAYKTISGSPYKSISFKEYGSNSKLKEAAGKLDGTDGSTGFHLAFESIANKICSKDQKLLLLMYTDGIMNNGDFNSDNTPKNASWNTVKQACADGSAFYVMTYVGGKNEKTQYWNPTKTFNLGDSTGMNGAIAKYFEDNYCVEQ